MAADEWAFALQMTIDISADHDFARRNLDRLFDGITMEKPQTCNHGANSLFASSIETLISVICWQTSCPAFDIFCLTRMDSLKRNALNRRCLFVLIGPVTFVRRPSM